MHYIKLVVYPILVWLSLLAGCGHIPPYSMVKPLKLYGLEKDAVQGKSVWIAGIRPARGGIYVDVAIITNNEDFSSSQLAYQMHYLEISDENNLSKEAWLQVRTQSKQTLKLYPPSRPLLTGSSLLTRTQWKHSPNYLIERVDQPDLLIKNLRFKCVPRIHSGVYEVRFTQRLLDRYAQFGVEVDGDWRTFDLTPKN